MTASATIVAVIAAYLLVLIGIGFWASRESKDISGYYVGHKRLPAWVIAFSANTTGESAWLLLGLTGMGYLVGIHAFWVVKGKSGSGSSSCPSGTSTCQAPPVVCAPMLVALQSESTQPAPNGSRTS